MAALQLGRGILTAAVTPFGPGGAVDAGALADLAEFYAKAGVQGVFALGTAGEAMLMDSGERRFVAERLSEALDGRLPVLLHCGTPDTGTTVALARHAAGLPVAQLAAIAPFYYRYATRELEAHFLAVAGASDLPLYVYDNPATVGYEVGVTSMSRLMASSGQIVGVKDTGDSVGRVVGYLALERPPKVYTGNNELIHASLSVGAEGAVSALSATLPELVGSVFTRHEAGDLAGALELQLVVARVMAAIRPFPYIGAIKAIGRLRGLPVGSTRAPQRDLDPQEVDALRDRLARIEGLGEFLRSN